MKNYTKIIDKKKDPRRLKTTRLFISFFSKVKSIEEKKEVLAHKMGISRATLYRYLSELEDSHLIEKYSPADWPSGVGLKWIGGKQ